MKNILSLTLIAGVLTLGVFAQAATPVPVSNNTVVPVKKSPTSSSATSTATSTEDWKGNDSSHNIDVGAMAGIGTFRGSGGFAIMGSAAKELITHGFVPDIDDAVYLEVIGGPIILQGSADFHLGARVRWDFAKDLNWTLYATGGLNADITGSSLNNAFDIYPAFSVGAFFKVTQAMYIRGEVSHEFTGVGVVFPF